MLSLLSVAAIVWGLWLYLYGRAGWWTALGCILTAVGWSYQFLDPVVGLILREQ